MTELESTSGTPENTTIFSINRGVGLEGYSQIFKGNTPSGMITIASCYNNKFESQR